MPTIALALATAAICSSATPKLTPAVMKQAAWRIPTRCVLIAPKNQSDEKQKPQSRTHSTDKMIEPSN